MVFSTHLFKENPDHWPWQEPKLEIPAICKAYLSGLFFRENLHPTLGYPHFDQNVPYLLILKNFMKKFRFFTNQLPLPSKKKRPASLCIQTSKGPKELMMSPCETTKWWSGKDGKERTSLQDGPPVDSVNRCLIYVAKNARYNELVTGGYFMVYKLTNISGGPHPVL